MNRFFVTGLPRSRTAWLANWLTSTGSHCDHDWLHRGSSVEKLDQRAHEIGQLNPAVRAVGDSDSGLVFFAAELEKAHPGAPWLFVRRDPAEAEKCFRAAFAKCNPYCKDEAQIGVAFESCLKAYEAAKGVVTNWTEVEFAQLDDVKILKALHRHLLPGHWYDPIRTEMLADLRVQVIPEKL